MRALGGKTPGYITESPNPDTKMRVDELVIEILPSSRREQERLRAECLRRDNWRCVVTGSVDLTSAMRQPDLVEGLPGVASVQCAHILPLALANFDPNRDVEVIVFIPSILRLDLTRNEGLQSRPHLECNLPLFP